ncbi:MAG: SRPBCC domain-containing protein [Bacteroidia bacterium]
MKVPEMDWTIFRKRITIEKPMEEVYSAWATKDGMESWFLEKADYRDATDKFRKSNELVKKGDAFTWKWHNWDFEENGIILKENGIDLISFTFGSGGNVIVNLEPSELRTEIILTQENIPSDDKAKKDFFVGCSNGWTFWLTNLKAWMEYGITLNAKGLKQEETRDLVNS